MQNVSLTLEQLKVREVFWLDEAQRALMTDEFREGRYNGVLK